MHVSQHWSTRGFTASSVCLATFAYANVATPKKTGSQSQHLPTTLLARRALSRLSSGISVKQVRRQSSSFAVERVARLGEGIVAPRPFLAHANQPCPSEVREMAGRRRLRDSKHGGQIAHAQLAVLQQVQDSQPRAVGEGTEEAIDRQTRRLQRVAHSRQTCRRSTAAASPSPGVTRLARTAN